MNLQQIKSLASLEQKLLIEKVETLVRSEYDKDELLNEVRKDYLDRVQKGNSKIVDRYIPFFRQDQSLRWRDNYQIESFFKEITDLMNETAKEYDHTT